MGATILPDRQAPESAVGAPSPERQLPLWLRWAVVLGAGLVIAALPAPAGITPASWRIFAVFVSTILGLIFQPLPGGAMVLLGVTATTVLGLMPPAQALAGYADPIVWLVLAAFMIARGMIKTGLGRRVALLFIRALGRTSLGLAYALACTDGVLAMIIPSNGARAGGIIFPIARSIAEGYDSHPGPTARRLGAFLMTLIYQTDVIVCAMFLTGQASNVLIAKFARETTGIDLSYGRWALGALVPGLAALLLVPLVVYRMFPPEVKHTPGASEYASGELREMGPMSRGEKLMLGVFALVLSLWLTTGWHHVDYAVVALLGIAVLLVSGVLTWGDVVTERGAWDVFIWYGGLVQLAKMLGETGITKWFAGYAAHFASGWQWGAALALLLLVYFYAHYAFASITAHATAMYIPFLVVTLAAGAPPYLAVLLLAYFSNLDASLTHFGTTPAPIYFGAGYVSQKQWWKIGLAVSVPNIVLWSGLGLLWWKALGWW